jgi:small subunit ribosomal protein S1
MCPLGPMRRGIYTDRMSDPENTPHAPPEPAPTNSPDQAPATGQPAPPPPRGPRRPEPRRFGSKPPMADRVAARREAAADKPSSTPPALDRQDTRPEPPKMRELDAMIEAELDAAMAGMSDAEMYPEPAETKPRGKGEPAGMQKGKVIRVHQADVFIDIPGGRSQGLMPMTQFPDAPPKVGDVVEFQIDHYDPANGLLILNRKGAAVAADWNSVQIGQIVEARVTGTNKGGLAVEVNGIRAFLPISQIDLYRVENVEQYVNQKMLCMVAEVNPAERNLVVSRRALLEREREEKAVKLWAELAEGQIRTGTIRSVKPFGAFVDLGGVDGLIPVSELSYKRVQDPSEVVHLGQAVQVYVTRIDPEARKVSLSLRKLLANPWDEIALKYIPGENVTGTVTRLLDVGALVELEPGIEGLIHISQLAPQRVWRVSDVVQAGQTVEVRILSVDKERERISLSLKDAIAKPEPAAAPAEEGEEPAAPPKPPKPRTAPLRGGIGSGGPLFPEMPPKE